MMRMLKQGFDKPDRTAVGTATSIAVHAVLITLAVLATNPPPGFVSALNSLANRVIYVAPPPRIPSMEASREQLKYFDAAPIGEGAGFAKGSQPGPEPEKPSVVFAARTGDLGTEKEQAVDSRKFASYDTVFSIAEVDSAVSIDPSSAAPVYPAVLQKLGIEGSVMVRYVVDTMGMADLSTLTIVRSTRIEFAIAVREALPHMRFSPARMGAKAVPQLVEQPFNFRIQKPDTSAAALRKPPM